MRLAISLVALAVAGLAALGKGLSDLGVSVDVGAGVEAAMASSTLFWIPRAMRSGATATDARASHSRVSGTDPVTTTR